MRLKTTASPQDWPAVGVKGVEMMERICWDMIPSSCDPLIVAPLDRIIEEFIPGLRYESVLRRFCKRCGETWVSNTKTHRQVFSTGIASVTDGLSEVTVHIPH
jgi:hypothetical protein